MRRFRVFLFLLLSILVPLQGYAHVAPVEACCPIEQSAVMEGMMEGEETAMHDCCPHAQGAGHAEKSCKPGHACHCYSLGILFPIPSFGVLGQELPLAVPYPPVAGFKPSSDPAATWRPPASL